MNRIRDLAVLHICPFQGFSGAPRSMLTLLEELSRRGIRQGLFLAREGEVDAVARALGAEVVSAHSMQSAPKAKLLRGMSSASSLRKMIAAFRPTLLHSASAMGMRYAWAASLGRRVPVVCHQRDNYAVDYFHLGLGRADRIIAISEHVKMQLPPRLQSRTDVVYNAVSAAQIPDPLPLRQPGNLRVAAAGRATPDKGFDILLDAASRLIGQYDFDLHLWGPDPAATSGYAGEIATAAKLLAARGIRVVQEPFRKDIENLYATADIVVVPSRFPEPFGRMAIEAMAWHKPLVVAGHGGLVEIIKDGWNGLTHRPADAVDLARQLGRLLGDERLRGALAANAAADVQARFRVTAHADRVLDVYERLLTARER